MNEPTKPAAVATVFGGVRPPNEYSDAAGLIELGR
jgi:hypothetical protein